MAWQPIADSGVGFTTELPDGVTLAGSVMTCVKSGVPEDQAWSIQLAKALPVRVTFLAFEANGYEKSGMFMFNGEIVDNQGGPDQWSPNPAVSPAPASIIVYVPGEQSDYPADSYTALIEVETGPATCQEIGRATRNYVSAYQRDRVARSSLYASERRCLVTDFNGAIPKGRSIVKAVWQTPDTMQAAMSAPRISGRQVEVTISAQYAGQSRIRVDATLDNGEVYSAWHVVKVMASPYFNNPGWSNGPQRLEVSA